MAKTLAIILNHNLPKITDWLYNELASHQGKDYELQVMDNGSSRAHQSSNTSIFIDTNVFWGGALNLAFQMVIDNPDYDSLLFLNNDIELNGSGFVPGLREVMFNEDFVLVAPCIAGRPQSFKQMQCWGSREVREVKWIDCQAPLIRRDLIEEIGQFDSALKYGWGIPQVMYRYCKNKNWRAGVCDHISILHHGKMTSRISSFKFGSTPFFSRIFGSPRKAFRKAALQARNDYFKDWEEYDEILQYGFNYSFHTDEPSQIELSTLVKRDDGTKD